MKKIVAGVAVLAGTVAAVRRYAPTLHERALAKCHDMMSRQGGCPPTDKAA